MTTDAAPIMTTKDNITKKLTEAFAPDSLDVTDESHLHEGHAREQQRGGRLIRPSSAYVGPMPKS